MIEIDIMYNKTDNGAGYLGYSTSLDAIIIVFRGTEVWSIKNWIDDIDYIPTDYPYCNNGCQVHEGFYHTWLDLKD